MFGEIIEGLMIQYEISQKELAKLSGCTESAISKYVNNKRTPSLKTLKRIAVAFGLCASEIVGWAEYEGVL